MWDRSRHSSLASVPSCPPCLGGGRLGSARRLERRRSLKLTALLLILLLSGCANSNIKPTLPPAPVLESLEATSEGGICMDRQDAQELLLYIDQLERLNR